MRKYNILAQIVVVANLLLWSAPGVLYAQTTQPPTPAATSANGLPTYTGRGVQDSIEKFLCAPTGDGSDLNVCVNRLYRFSISIGAFVLVFMIALAGYYYMLGSEAGKTKAKGLIGSAVAGMIILLSSFVLLNQINPALTKFRPIQPPIFSGGVLPTCEDVDYGETCILNDGQVFVGPGGGTGGAGSGNEAKYRDLITKYAQQRGIEYCALSALMQKESSFNYLIVSNAPPREVDPNSSPPTYNISFETIGHGIGLTQIYIYERRRGTSTGWTNGVPARAGREFGFSRPLYVQDLINPDLNVQAGSYLWSTDIKRANGNLYEAYRFYQGSASAPATLRALVDMYNACKARG